MKFNLRAALTAPAVLLMLSSVGATGANAVSANSNDNSQVKLVKMNGETEAYRLGDGYEAPVATSHHSHHVSHHDSKLPSILTQSATSIGGYGRYATGGTREASNAVVVTNIQQLRDVLHEADNQPVTVIIKGDFNGNYDAKDHKTLTASDYAKGTGYNFNQYLKDYNPKTYGTKEPSGDQENARQKAMHNQEKQITVNVPDNASIIGAPGNHVSNVNFKLAGHNDIMRNLDIQNPTDDFPGWDPKDGKSGNWNSQYDAISVRGGNDIWLDHITTSDGKNVDSEASDKTFGRQYQQHDGAIDITNGADNITVSHNKFLNHDKTMLIGNSDSHTSDEGKLHVTLNHNYFGNVTQRAPRLRFGHVDAVNNFYQNSDKAPYKLGYVWGYGKDATFTGDHNTLSTPNKDAVKKFVSGKDGQSIDAKNTDINGTNYHIVASGDKISMDKTSTKPDHPAKGEYRNDGATLNFDTSSKPTVKHHKGHHSHHSANGTKEAKEARIRARDARIRARNARHADHHKGHKAHYRQVLHVGNMILEQDPTEKGEAPQVMVMKGSHNHNHKTNNNSQESNPSSDNDSLNN